jgi:hypothetical protein
MIIQIFLENLQVFASPYWFELDENLRLRGALKEELRSLKDNFAGFDPTGVVEISVPNDGEFDKALARVRSVLTAILLYGDSLVKAQRLYRMISLPAKPDKPDPSSYQLSSPPSLWVHEVAASEKFPLKFMTPTDVNKFVAFWQTFQKVSKPGYTDAALYRYALACGMIPGQRLYRLVEYVSALEALLLENTDELSYKLAMRTSTIVATSGAERKRSFEFMKKAYALRSKTVHGTDPAKIGKLLPIRVDDRIYQLEDAIGELHHYGRICINSILTYLVTNTNLSKNDLATKLDKAVVGGSDWAAETVGTCESE